MYVLFFAFILFVCGIYAQDSSLSNGNKSVEDYYSQGKKYILEGDYENANRCFQKAEQLLNKEEGNIVRKEELRSGRETRDGNILSPVLNENMVIEADKAFRENNLDNALNLYMTVIETSRKDYNVYYNIGVIYLKKREYDNAVEAFKKVIEFHPRDADAYYNLGVIYENFIKDSIQAVRYYKKYLKFSNSRTQEYQMVKSWIKYIEMQEGK